MTRAATEPEIMPPLGRDPLLPMAWPVVVRSDGRAFIPDAFNGATMSLRPVCRGVGLAWSPVLEVGGILLCVAGGNPAQPSDELVAATLNRRGLRELIRDLQSIDQQLGDW